MKILIRFLDPEFIIAFTFICSILFLVLIRFWRHDDFIQRIVFLFLLMCASIILINGLLKIFPQRTDSIEDYIPLGLTIANSIRNGIGGLYDNSFKILSDNFLPYTFWVGLVFVITDDSLMAASFVSSIFGALTIYMIYKITKDIFDQETAKWSAILLAFSPFLLYMSVVIMRDTMVTFFIMWFYRAWLLYDKSHERRYAWLMAFTIFITGILRPPVMAVMVASGLTYKLFFEKREKQSRATRVFLQYLKIFLVLSGTIFLLAYLTGAVNIKSILESRLGSSLKYTQIEAINSKLTATSKAGSNYYPVAKHDSLTSIVQNVPLLVIYFLGSPFPWQIQKGSQLLAILLDSCVIWVICFLFLLEIRSFIRRNKKWAVILFTYLFLGICSASVVQTNSGGSQRHRIMFTLLMLPFAVHRVLTWFRGKKKETSRRGKYLTPVHLKPALVKSGPHNLLLADKNDNMS